MGVANSSTILQDQHIKTINYDYDLISGKVNEVAYQPGEVDQFYHRYYYDADNRITSAYTSKDNVIWEQDAKYFYYKHGPLARTELGDQKVQAMDYAYTIQGWLKGMNSNTLKETRDIGQDGEEGSTNLNRHFGRDAFGYSLNYFNSDYTPIGTITDNFIASTSSATYLSTDAPGLYNGNISSMVTTITNPTTGDVLPQLTAYRYDQLNRIKQMKAYRDINLSTNAWGSGSTYDGSYEEHYSYNANGSITDLTRNGLASVASGDMDAMTYKYETVANGYSRNTNKLRYILDAKSSGNYSDDMDNQGTDNYGYDEIGNLIKDDFECIQDIEWTVYGKVKKVTRTPSCTTEGSAMPDLEFNYDAKGNMVEKIVKPAATLGDASTWIHTYYVLDAQGNIMATYEKEDTDFTLAEQQIYGSSHIGTAKRSLDMSTSPSTTEFTRTLGKKHFFLKDHRENNNVTVLDRKIPVESGITPGTIAYFSPATDRAVDFFPFGREMNGRFFNRDNSEFGYNGKQNIKEWSARLGGAQLYGSRIKFGEGFLSRDPLSDQNQTWSPYVFAIDNPIVFVDKNGEWPGVTIFYLEFEVGAGLGYGLNYVKQGGVAYDEVGRTRFTASSALYIANQTDAKMSKAPEIVAGASVSGTVNFKQNWEAETFQGIIGKPATGLSLPNGVKGKAGYLLAVGASLSQDELQLGLGVGVGLKISVISTTIDESISLTDAEAGITDLFGGMWSIGNKSAVKNAKGEITGYKANVLAGDKNTGIEVFSESVKDAKGNTQSSNIWSSKNYTEEATKVEKEDDAED